MVFIWYEPGQLYTQYHFVHIQNCRGVGDHQLSCCGWQMNIILVLTSAGSNSTREAENNFDEVLFVAKLVVPD